MPPDPTTTVGGGAGSTTNATDGSGGTETPGGGCGAENPSGNVFMVVPAVLLVNTVVVLLLGRPMISPTEAEHVLGTLTLLGPTLMWAGFTGCILFAASMIAGWTENWFVLHRLDSAMRH